MQHLLSNYHPDLAPLALALRAGLEASVTATRLRPAVTVPRWTTVLARVSDESRTKFLTNLDEDLDWLLDSEPAAWVKANVTDVEVNLLPDEGEPRAELEEGVTESGHQCALEIALDDSPGQPSAGSIGRRPVQLRAHTARRGLRAGCADRQGPVCVRLPRAP